MRLLDLAKTLATGGYRVDATEDAVANLLPPQFVDPRVDAVSRACSDGLGDVRAYTCILVGINPTLRHVPPNAPSSISLTSRFSKRSSRMVFPDPLPMISRS